MSEDHIIEAFWPKDNIKNKNNLYWGTTTLRSALRSLNPTTELLELYHRARLGYIDA